MFTVATVSLVFSPAVLPLHPVHEANKRVLSKDSQWIASTGEKDAESNQL